MDLFPPLFQPIFSSSACETQSCVREEKPNDGSRLCTQQPPLRSLCQLLSSVPAVSDRLRRSSPDPPGPGFWKPCRRPCPPTRCLPVYSEQVTNNRYLLTFLLKASVQALPPAQGLTSANLDQLKDLSGWDGWGMFFFFREGPSGAPGGGGMPPIAARPGGGGPPGGGGGGGGGGMPPGGGGGGGHPPPKGSMDGGGGTGPPGGPGGSGGPPGTGAVCLCRGEKNIFRWKLLTAGIIQWHREVLWWFRVAFQLPVWPTKPCVAYSDLCCCSVK